MTMQKSTFIQSLFQQEIDHTPIWLMRQAGRYLPEYRATREKAGSFLNLCKNPDLATLVTLQPLKRFDLDAAILFSDILVVPEALGMELTFINGEGPKFSKPLIDEVDIDNLNSDDVIARLSYVFKTIESIKTELTNKPLIGFSGSPFTLACYMIAGGSSTDYFEIKKWLYTKPAATHKLLNKLTNVVIQYLNTQIESGVDTVMLFDSWGGVLSNAAYEEFSLQYLKRIVENLVKKYDGKDIPNIVFTKGGGVWLDKIAALKSTAIGLDWTIDIAKAKSQVGVNTALQGNLDPIILAVGDKLAIKKDVIRVLDSYKNANNGNISGHVFNLGHGVIKTTNPDNVAYLVDIVHELSSK
jgi:uroporphyrinogen decarboxylase